MNFKKILVPVDGSEATRPLLEYARRVAGEDGADIIVLHVVDRLLPKEAYIGGFAEFHDQHVKEAKGWMEALHPILAGTHATWLVVSGTPSTAILTCASQQAVDLIVMVTHRRNALARLVLGGCTEAVIKGGVAPVMTIPESRLVHAAVA